MRLHRSRDLESLWYTLPPEIRGFVNSLKVNPRPEGARSIPERPGRFEDFIAGYWIIWEVDQSGSETIVRVEITE